MRRLLLAACLFLPAVLGGVQAGAQTLRIGLREDPDVLDPTLGSSYVGRIVYAAMCDKLFDLDPRLNIVPQLAAGYEYADPTHLLIRLRPGVTFQDREPLDAEAVKTSLTRHLTARGSMRAGEVNAIQAIEVVDPLTVRLVLKAPAAQLLAQLTDRAGIIMSPKALDQAGDKFGLRPVCAGAYAFDSRVVQDRIVLKRDPGYWDAANHHFDQVVYQPITNPAVRVANLRAGSLDLVEFITPSDMAAVQADPKLTLVTGDALGYTGINFNVNNGAKADSIPGRDARVRRAFELAIDRTALIQTVYNGLFTATAQANPPSSPMFVPAVQPPARDVDKARALLREAGVALPVPIQLTTSNSPDIQQAAEVIQAMAAEAGFAVTLRTMEFASSLQAGYSGDFQAYMIGWSGRSDADGNTWQLLHSGGTFNFGRYTSPVVDRLLDEARLTTDVDARRALYAQVWQQEREDMPLVYLWTARNIVGMKKALTGFQQVPDGLIRLRGVRLAP